MPEYAIIRLRAKRQTDLTRWTPRAGGGSDYSDGHTGYTVPKLTSSHVATPRMEQGTLHTLMFSGRADAAVLKSRTESLLKRNGLDPYRVYLEDADTLPHAVTIESDRSGFMATITLRLDLRVR